MNKKDLTRKAMFRLNMFCGQYNIQNGDIIYSDLVRLINDCVDICVDTKTCEVIDMNC